MGLHKVTFSGSGQLDDGGEFLGIFSNHTGAQGKKVGSDLEIATQNVILEGHHHTRFRRFHRRRIFSIVSGKYYALFSGFGIVLFQKSIGPDIPVKDENLGIRPELFDMKGIFDGALAADSGAVGVLVVSRSHTLDHDHPVQIPGPFFF